MIHTLIAQPNTFFDFFLTFLYPFSKKKEEVQGNSKKLNNYNHLLKIAQLYRDY